MRFSQLLSILNCYIGQEKSQQDFMYLCFQQVMLSPFTENDEIREENDNYYPFSRKTETSAEKKVYLGERPLAKNMARFVKSHFDGSNLMRTIDEMDDIVKGNLCQDLSHFGVLCDEDSVGDVVSSLFLQFVEAAIDEKDTIQTGIIANAEIRLENDDVTNHDTMLLIEVNNKCPLCGEQLLKQNGKDKYLKFYTPTQIFPKDVNKDMYLSFRKHSKLNGDYNQQDNLIALCTSCSLNYASNPTEEEFLKLIKIKNALRQESELQQGIDDINIEMEISDVIYDMINIDKVGELAKFRMDALNVRQKIKPNNKLLINFVTDNVTRYYNYIEGLFAEVESNRSGTFNRIATEISLVYQKIKDNGLSQDDIYEYIKKWIKGKLQIELQNDMAISAVVSFFIQNCEVFDEIS